MVKLVLVVLFIAVPLAELALLIEIGRRVGVVTTIALIIVTGALGAALARRQGLGVLRDMRSQLAAGKLPASSLVDGVIILVAAALLITPGILTDTVGFLCLIPPVRRALKAALWRRLQRAVREGGWRVSVRLDR